MLSIFFLDRVLYYNVSFGIKRKRGEKNENAHASIMVIKYVLKVI